ncbi:hypothetical protein S7711_02729 [Stachybotrys chartarum IBT 7711]|uniref:Zn(2)-C6 fungal-type domain-containing protein n=1 Tax=Stachybotrys chartarum (strain CBS 109288 / IBT 7711) TaxID=1280523 RepID=A0A084AZ50_STACB|nr:hypothetical protein S7711_02729 [Stachybotrys chartarum IBT 7711]KFA45984.1 hypothetical protein S40293_09205 [Stachybotrys chartarum IBT 40293]
MSAQNARPNLSHDDDGLRIWSCIHCRRRKIRCDRREPCSNCVRVGVECHFPVTGRLPRRRNATGSQSQKQTELLSRLRRLESIVTELGIQIGEGAEKAGISGAPSIEIPLSAARSFGRVSEAPPLGPSPSSVPTTEAFYTASEPTHSGATSVEDDDFGELIVARNGGLHVGNRFWTIFCSEVDHIFRFVEEVEEADVADEDASHRAPVLLFGQQSLSNDGSQPLSSRMMFIWQTFVDRVDPFVKVLHVPSVERIVTALEGGISGTEPKTQALLGAISLATLVSLDEEEVAANFSQPKSQLVNSYRSIVEQALAQAGFLSTKDMTVLQAFVIYLAVLPRAGGEHAMWQLTGLLVRVATSMGLHRDDAKAGAPPLELELRRRMWWQIYLLDSSSADPRLAQLSISEEMFDTNLPTNVNDDDLESRATPSPSAGEITRTTLFLIRCEMRRLARMVELNRSKTLQFQLDLVERVRNTIWSALLREIDSGNALNTYVEAITLFSFAKIRIGLYTASLRHSQHRDDGKGVSNDNNLARLVDSSLQLVELTHKLLTKPSWEKWRWQVRGQIPAAAVSLVLLQLQRGPWSDGSEQAWATIQALLGAVRGDASPAALRDSVAATQAHRDRCLAGGARSAAGFEVAASPLVGGYGAADEMEVGGYDFDAALQLLMDAEMSDPSLFDFGIL